MTPDLPGGPPHSPTELPTGVVTFLFTDIEGSTQLSIRLGDGFAAVIDRHHALMRAAIGGADGLVVSTEGDAFFAVFRRVDDAVRAAVDAQRGLAAEAWPNDETVRVRMGIHTGDGRIGGDSYAGADVNRAARVSAAGHGGQVLLSASAHSLLDPAGVPGIALRDLGEHALRDLPEPIRLFQLDIEGLPSDFPPLRARGQGNLPTQATSFVGREDEIAAVAALLEHARLVTLTGPGGTGKTRLSVAVAHHVSSRFADGAWFVPLDSVRDPNLVVPTISSVLGVQEQPGRAPEDSLIDHLGERRLLLVIDNFEQVVEAAAAIDRVLRAAPDLRVLVSSREILRLSSEQEFPVPPLSMELAVRLFVDRARLVRPGIGQDADELEAIGRICERLERMPLAIELAAARTRLFPPAQLLRRLDDRLATLASELRDLPPRQRSLRGAIDWSFDLLDGPERTTFARLSVFAGGADLEAVEAVIGDVEGGQRGTLDLVSSLIEKSLVVQAAAPGGDARFRMLETIREYAAERLAEDSDGTAVAERHAMHFVERAEATGPALEGRDPRSFFDRLDVDHDNIRAAIAWSLAAGRPELGLRIGASIWRFWQQRGHLAEGRERLEALLAAGGDIPDAVRARALTALGGVTWWMGDVAATEPAYVEALALQRRIGDRAGIAGALYDLSYVELTRGRPAEAQQMQAESEELFASVGDGAAVTRVREARATAALLAGDLAAARVMQESVIAEFRRRGLGFKLADGLALLAVICIELGDTASARVHMLESLSTFDDLRARPPGFIQLAALLVLAEGRPADAARLVGAFDAMREVAQGGLTPVETLHLRDPKVEARAALDPAEFERAYAEGRAWDEARLASFLAG